MEMDDTFHNQDCRFRQLGQQIHRGNFLSVNKQKSRKVALADPPALCESHASSTDDDFV
jgi:hypothetical protein